MRVTGDLGSPAESGLRCGSGPGAGRLLLESWEPGKLVLRSEGEGLQGRLICGVSRSTYWVLARKTGLCPEYRGSGGMFVLAKGPDWRNKGQGEAGELKSGKQLCPGGQEWLWWLEAS